MANGNRRYLCILIVRFGNLTDYDQPVRLLRNIKYDLVCNQELTRLIGYKIR
jgi:hypothetical protein